MNERREPWFELSAVPIALVVMAAVLAALVGLWTDPWTAALVTVGYALTVIAIVVAWSNRRSHPPAADTPHVTPIADGRHRVLVVADTAGASAGLVDALRTRAAGRPLSVFLAAPALESRVGHLTSDQHGYDDAARRLREILHALGEADVPARGAIGSADPIQTADDGLRQFPADEILFVTQRDARANWLEDGVVGLAGSRYEQPVDHLAIS